MRIIGNSEDAIRLSQEIVQSAGRMVEETNALGQALGKLEETFLDNEVVQIEEITKKIMEAINEYMDDIRNVKIVMDNYAELLRRRGR